MAPASSVMAHPTHRFIDRWPTERPLFLLCVVLSLGVWALLAVSVLGIVYAALIAVFFLFAHATFVAHVRGNGIRLSDQQFPELYGEVRRLADQLAMEDVPEAYLMQAGGTLNAFATKFYRSNFIVLFTDLLEACEGNQAARNMIIAHELGHLKAGHLRWRWLIAPAALVPFLGTALSRAREYTCDRYGLAGAGDVDGAILGLTVLAAGGKHALDVNLSAFLAQRATLNTGWMAIGEWLSTHPPLAKRVAQLMSPASRPPAPAMSGNLRGAAILGSVAAVGTIVTATVLVFGTAFLAQVNQAMQVDPYGETNVDVAAAADQVQEDFDRLSAMLESTVGSGNALPTSWAEVEGIWLATFPTEPVPYDPFDGARYGYMVEPDGRFVLWSSGPDAIPGTDDDIIWRSIGVRRPVLN